MKASLKKTLDDHEEHAFPCRSFINRLLQRQLSSFRGGELVSRGHAEVVDELEQLHLAVGPLRGGADAQNHVVLVALVISRNAMSR